ncbi:Predicted outer membrane protein [Legionella lansingensis]|uniref:DUF4142 domain-containing protein n=1 Tax=Legionella lansingensis TaxID=45067 RepID=A0A0W0VSH1_9GAMM|nr:DUF4142 domain-containing protein [Legionella lansingensis]KTD22909.1 hypothetical protein Llan_1026 [Legionella lansingensis]SNV53881.1 Predicted outer membrane protein [Legionella lansingensis]
MKSKILFLSLCTMACSSVFAVTPSHTTNSGTAAQASAAQNQQDGEVIGFLIVLNQNEMAAAKDALNKKVNPKVKSYARMLYNDHSKNLKDTMKISKKIGQSPAQTNKVASLKRKGEKAQASLSSLQDTDFEVAYIDAMVRGHEEALIIIDENLINNVNNPDLKKHLKTTRSHVQQHLNAAKQIQQNLKSQASS